ncbi:DOCK family protein [Tieghemostelium lacteum]|uniref:DOCK family protein n=1 Tax=Tieghemostelium lacteum TaxID=361077 RepID=A0A151ZAV1_TIELA|nr:DOCK family protein [Tieghemostelium lacteum]|eukprot:KYQ91082.1 DOCK family protein [Tieghemostelium lacteum]
MSSESKKNMGSSGTGGHVISAPSTLSVSSSPYGNSSKINSNPPSPIPGNISQSQIGSVTTSTNGNSQGLSVTNTTQVNSSSTKSNVGGEMSQTNKQMTTDYKFDDYEEQFFNKAVINDQLKISLIPDLLNVQTEKRQSNLLGQSSVPEDIVVEKLPKGIQESMAVCNQTWTLISRSELPTTTNTPIKKLDSQPYLECELSTAVDSVKDLNQDLLQTSAGPTPDTKTLDLMKSVNRVPLFKTIPTSDDDLSSIEPAKIGKAISEYVGFQFTVECVEFKPQIGHFEPFFGRMFLFDTRASDLKSGVVSEEFHFDSGKSLELLPKTSDLEMPTKFKKSLFSVATRSSSIHLVVCFDKVILGDPEETTKAYFNTSQKPKELEKFKNEVKDGVQRLGHFRQTFLWGCVELFDQQNHQFLFGNGNETEFKLTSLVKSKGDLLNFITKEKKSTKDSVFDCTLRFQQVSTSTNTINPSTGQEIYQYSESLEGRVDHHLRPKKGPTSQPQPFVPLVKEILQFDYQPVDRDEFGKDSKEPYIQYSNLLYLYPKSVNLTNFKSDKGSSARNIFLEVKLLEDDTNVNNQGLKNIYGTSLNPILTRKFYTQVIYHNRKPKFTDEIKINLPANLTPNHHLLVTFYHLGCRQSKKSDKPEVPLGYCAIRLFENDQIIVDNKYKKPVATVFPPKYLAEEAKDPKDPTNLKMWVDNKKPVFSFRTRVISSIYPQDPVLSFMLRNSTECDHNLLNEQIKKIDSVPKKLKSQYFPAVIRVLFKCITSLSTEIAHNAFAAILNLCDNVPEDQLSSYVTYIFSNACATVTLYDSLIQTWNHFLETADVSFINLSIQYSWFLFGIIKKSMISEIDIKNTLKSGRNRTGRFSDEVLNRLKYLFDQLLIQLKQNYKNQLTKFKLFIVYIGHFINDLLDILNRGFVFKLIHSYVTGLDSSNTIMELVDFKSRFFRVLAMNDNFIALNIPMPFPFPSTVAEVYQTFYKRNFLVGLLLQEVSTIISAKERTMRITCIQTLREIMSRFDTSAFYNNAPMRERIAALYFPYILTLVDNYQLVNKFDGNELKIWLICFIYVVKNLINGTVITEWWKKETPGRKMIFFNLLNKCVQTFDYGKDSDHFGMLSLLPASNAISQSTSMNGSSGTPGSGHNKAESVDQSNNDSPSRRFKKGINSKPNTPGSGRPTQLTPDKAKEQIEQNLALSMAKSERTYSMSQSLPPNLQQPSSNTVGAPLSGSNPNIPNTNGGTPNGEKLNNSTSSTSSSNLMGTSNSPAAYRSFYNTSSLPTNKSSLSFDLVPPMLENLTHEVSLTVLNCLVSYIREYKVELLKNQSNSFLDMIFKSIISILSLEQSHVIVKTCFCILSSMISEFKTILFKLNNTVCADLTQVIFDYSYSSHGPDRQLATTLVYILIHNNLREMGNFSRMKLQSTVAISRILNVTLNDPEQKKKDHTLFFQYLYASLESITKFVKLHCNSNLLKTTVPTPSVSTAKGTTVGVQQPSKPKQIIPLSQQMDDLRNRLFGVIQNNEKIQQYSYDPEMKADLYYNLANTFIESPDLRITWLKSLAAFLKENKNYEEAAQVNIIAAALVSGYLKLLNRYPKDIVVDFSIVSPNIVSELTLPDITQLEDVEGEICKLDDFNETGFINLLKEAIYLLKCGCFFESCADTYRLLLPTYQRQRDWQKQIECYNELRILCVQIISENTASQRIFSNYYRVAFYSKNLIPELNEKEFIYKELNFLRLADIAERLKNQYGAKFGEDKVKLLPNNKPVEVNTLDPNQVYIQIVSVDPYLLPEELSERISPFEQNTNLNKFIFEIPFSKTGKLSDNIGEQWKRKVILTTKSHFPYMKKRVPIISKKELELTPIEASIELLSKKIVDFRAELNTSTPNTKTLQINLQGCLLLQVNAGPLAVCSTFLSQDSFSKYNADHITKLSEVIKEFTNVLAFSLSLNKRLSKNESPELVAQLDISYKAFRESVSQYVELTPSEDSLEN